MPCTRRAACEQPSQPAGASANTLSHQLSAAGRPDEDGGCLATTAESDRMGAVYPCDKSGLLPPDVDALATPRCRAHAQLLRQHWLLLSLHWAACSSAACGHSGGAAASTGHGKDPWPFGHGSCAYGGGLWRHIRSCSGAHCSNAMCLPTRQLTTHFCACCDDGCSLCRPVRQALALLSQPPQRASRRATGLRQKAEAGPEAALLRQLCGAVADGEATLEEVAPTRYNLVRLVLDDMHRAAAGHGSGGDGPHSPCMSAASSNTLCFS